jgi:integrase
MSKTPSYIRKGENLYQNPLSGTYFAFVRYKQKQLKSSLKTTDFSEAKRKLRDFMNDLGKVDPRSAKMTMAGLVDLYLLTLGNQAPSTVAKKRAMAIAIKNVSWGNRQARSITPSDVLMWRSRLTKTESKEKLGPNTRNKFLRTLRAIFKLGVDDRLLIASPVAGIKEERVPKPIRNTPSFEDFMAIVDDIRSQPLSDTREESADFTLFLGLAGLGLAEAQSLTWGDVHFDRGEIITFRHKTAAGFRVPIYPQLRPLLEKRLNLATKAQGGMDPVLTERVFTVQNPKKAIENACQRLGYVRISGERQTARYSSRSFRRLFITRALEKGIDVGVVADWQGHRDGGKLLLSTYRHARTAHGDAMAQRLTLEPPSNVIPLDATATDLAEVVEHAAVVAA